MAHTRWEVWLTLRQARLLRRSRPAAVRICWDLDNTLVDSGTLLRGGKRLEDAIVEAEPVPNMLAFYETMRGELPNAEHFIVSARTRSMRANTLAWLKRQGLMPTDGAVLFVPYPEAKLRVWRELARGAQLVIVDDLSYNHESSKPSIYHELVGSAESLASVYVGLDQIARIAQNSDAVEAVAFRTIETLAAKK